MDKKTSSYNFSEKARKITFGKYKGRYIIELIFTHIGYIMWCLNNIKFFYLTAEEQAAYDALSIAIIRDNEQMTFPIEGLKDFIKDKEHLNNLDSPIFFIGSNTYIDLRSCNSTLRDINSKYKDLIVEGYNNEIRNTKRKSTYDENFYKTVKSLDYELRKFEEHYPLDDDTNFDFFKDS